jgi:hypothetical protein
VAIIGADDKRQITAVLASALDGTLLPLQLIFTGKTPACHPPSTDASREARVHITHSPNHWSNQETMREWVTEVLLPYADRQMLKHNLPAGSNIVLMLDVWSVHISEEFRLWLRMHHSHIHLVYVPPNCTSKLQVADVVLQRPFKHGVRRRFTEWATEVLKQQIQSGNLLGLNPYLKMGMIKPSVLQWCVDSWNRLKDGTDYITMGWHTCVVQLFNVHDVAKRIQAVEEVAKAEVDGNFVPKRGNGTEAAIEDTQTVQSDESGSESDEEGDELDVMKQRQFGTRKSDRKRKEISNFGYQINSEQIAFTSSSEA